MRTDTNQHFWTEKELETARSIVKRCGIRDGLFKGPRTQNAVESIAYALATVRKEARAAAFKEVGLLVSTRLAELKIQTASLDGLSGAACLGRDIAIEDLLRTIEAAANDEEGAGNE